jgi:hypothetical protein
MKLKGEQSITEVLDILGMKSLDEVIRTKEWLVTKSNIDFLVQECQCTSAFMFEEDICGEYSNGIRTVRITVEEHDDYMYNLIFKGLTLDITPITVEEHLEEVMAVKSNSVDYSVIGCNTSLTGLSTTGTLITS